MSKNWVGCLNHNLHHNPSEKPRESPTNTASDCETQNLGPQKRHVNFRWFLHNTHSDSCCGGPEVVGSSVAGKWSPWWQWQQHHKRPCILYHGSSASYGFECLMVVWLGGVTVGSDVIDATEWIFLSSGRGTSCVYHILFCLQWILWFCYRMSPWSHEGVLMCRICYSVYLYYRRKETCKYLLCECGLEYNKRSMQLLTFRDKINYEPFVTTTKLN